jgi:hypothetical protein
MTEPSFLGSAAIRIAALVLGLITLGLVQGADSYPPYGSYLATATGLLTFIAVIFSFTSVYRLWMRFASALHEVMIAVLFGVCYCTLVPVVALIVWFRDPLRLGKQPRTTAWVRRDPDIDPLSFQRMG